MKLRTDIPIKYCIECGIAIKRGTKSTGKRIATSQYIRAKFCSLKCKGKFQKETWKSEDNPNYRGGKSVCVDCKKLLTVRYSWKQNPRCRVCNYKYAVGENSSNWKGGICFPNCINCGSKTGDSKSSLCHNCYRGALHPFWNGGTSQLQSLIRASKENRQWIKQCMYRDNYICRECGIESTGNNLQVHHLRQFAQILKDNNIKTLAEAKECKELWNNDNGITLCKECHKLTDSFNRKLSNHHVNSI